MLDKCFQDVPVAVVLWGNMLVSMVGAIFIYGAPTADSHKKLKKFFLLFWIALIIYYLARAPVEALDIGSQRLSCFIRPWDDFSVHPYERFWFLLVVLADLPLFMLSLGHIFNNIQKKKKAILFSTLIFIVFLIVWLLDFLIRHNAASSLLAFAVFFYTAWSCRIEHISSSILWITYALLHTPIGLAAAMPFEWRHTIFVVLLVSKLSLIAAMYSMLEVKKTVQN